MTEISNGAEAQIVTQSKPEPERVLGQTSYWGFSIVMAVSSSVLIYKITVWVSPEAAAIPKGYYAFALGAVIILAGFITAWAAKLAKIENRNLDKAFFATTGAYFLNALFSLASAPFARNHPGSAFLISLLGGVLGWFFIKHIYGTNHKKIARLFLWLALIMGAVAFVVGVIGAFMFSSALKNAGI